MDSISAVPLTAQDAALLNARKRVKEMREFYINLTLYCCIIPILWLINIFTSGPWWAHWATIGWGIGVTIHGLTVFADGTFFGAAWEEKKVAELMAREQLKVVSSEKQLVQAQMRMLQAQIEPHFLFNTLANIQSQIPRAPEKANAMLDNFIAYLRQTLSASRAQEGTVKQEFDLIRNYLEILKIRMGDRLQFDLEIDASVESTSLPPMLLQPLVENAVKHGLEPKVEGGRVRVRATREEKSLRLVVEDNGLGFGEHADSKGTGVGLANLRERLRVIYDGLATLNIVEASPGTRVEISLPVNNKAS
jgi:sensor histidine kinase YesM